MAKLNRTRWTRSVLIAVLVALGGYTAALGYIYVEQRHYIYYPTGGGQPDADGPPIEVRKIQTADGETLTAWYLPARPGRPTLLFFNGNAAGLEMQAGRWRRIANEGVGLMTIGYRGYEGSTGVPTEEGLHQDALAAYAWLTARVPVSDIVIDGFSLGSGVATRLASEKPARALVLEAPYTAAVDVAARYLPWAPVSLLMTDQFRSRDRIGKVRMPILIVHGEADSVIPVAQGQRLYDLAKAPKTFVRMAGSDHNTLTRDGLYDHVWRFLDLPVSGTTAANGHQAKAVIRSEVG